MNELPNVSIVIATLNAGGVIVPCFEAIKMQDYPQENIEIILGDGGSTDNTLELAEKYGALVVHNPLKTAESGKAVAVRAASGDYIAIVDSDNIMPDENWLKQMILPLEKHKEAVGSEPWEYTWRKEDSYITRYCALIGMNDPFVHFMGNYDRMNLLTGKWTEVEHTARDMGDYIVATFDRRGLPTIGANGAVFRTPFLMENLVGDYLFDIDILAKNIKEKGSVTFIKTKNGIIHTYCEADMGKFAKKQKRRVKDFLYHKFEAKDREFEWETKDPTKDSATSGVVSLFTQSLSKNSGMLRFLFSCITVVPLVAASIRGYRKKKDWAWFFHPIACEITLWQYGKETIIGLFKKEEISRDGWKQ